MKGFLFLISLRSIAASPVELKDEGDGLTGPQPSILGSVDKIFNQVNDFDQKECLQKMICEFMGRAEDVVVNSVNNQLGPQTGQAVQTGINQFQTNPSQFLQTNQLGQNGPIVQAVTAQLGGQGNNLLQSGQQLFQNGQQLIQNGQQFLQSGQQFAQTQFPQNGNRLVQVQQGGQTFYVPQNQLVTQNQLLTSQNQPFVPQNQQFSQQNQPFIPQSQFAPQNQFGQQQFASQSQNTFQQQSQPSSQPGTGNGLVDGIVDTLAGMIATATGRKRKKRQTTAHGQAIKVMQSLGLNKMGAYPFVRAAIIGHASKGSTGSCQQLYRQCPSGTDQLLNYLNNHNGGLFSNTLPSVTNEVGSLFPGLSSLPQVAASTFLDLESSSSNTVASSVASQGSGGGGLVGGIVDTLAGVIASVTGRK